MQKHLKPTCFISPRLCWEEAVRWISPCFDTHSGTLWQKETMSRCTSLFFISSTHLYSSSSLWFLLTSVLPSFFSTNCSLHSHALYLSSLNHVPVTLETGEAESPASPPISYDLLAAGPSVIYNSDFLELVNLWKSLSSLQVKKYESLGKLL